MEHGIKMITVSIASFLSAILGVLYVPVLLMVLCNIVDYITGLIAAGYREDGISSYKSIKGITKKVSMWLLVVVGAIIDGLIKYCTDIFGLDLHINFLVAAVVAVWIICNELISILENMLDIGVKLPKALIPLVKYIKGEVENKIPNPDSDDTSDESEGK